MTTPSIGLRDRKRAETRSRLESAAVDLVLRDGIDNTTVEAVCERANVSTRTFFNYFPTKEDAVLGLRERELTAEEILDHAERYVGLDITEAVVGLVFDALGSTPTNTALRHQRLELLHKHPDLLGRNTTMMMRMSQKLAIAVTALLAKDDRTAHLAATNGDQPSAASRVLLAMCTAAVKTAVAEWADDDSSTDPASVRERAMSIVRDLADAIT